MLRLLAQKVRTFCDDKRGDFSIKGLVITVGVIVVVGAVVTWLATDGEILNFIGDVWDSLGGWLEAKIGLGW